MQTLNILVLYDDHAVVTSYVHEHVSSMARHSRHNVHFMPATRRVANADRIADYDAVVIHFCVRLPFEGSLDPDVAAALAAFRGVKIAMPQDEYDLPYVTARRFIELGVHAVFTTVPEAHRAAFYPPEVVDGISFHDCLTGYVTAEPLEQFALPLPARPTMIAYRGRRLPVWYGRLPEEKYEIGVRMRLECQARAISHDIDVREEARVLGDDWYRLLGSARATLASESGANVVDPVGHIRALCQRIERERPELSREEVYDLAVASHDGRVVMNQLPPKVFEAAKLQTALILFEGHWSGILRPWDHYIPLRKDWSNLDEVLAALADIDLVSRMTERAHADLVESHRYDYARLVERIDAVIESEAERHRNDRAISAPAASSPAALRGDPTDGMPLAAPVPVPPLPPPPPLFVTPVREPILSGRWRRFWLAVPTPVRVLFIALFGPVAERLAQVWRDHRTQPGETGE